MPGLLEEVGPSLFDIPHLEYVEFGAALSRVEPGTFQKSRLIGISIDSENPWLQTDGAALERRQNALSACVPLDLLRC